MVSASNWIARSNTLAACVVSLMTTAAPEAASQAGLMQADPETTDLREGWRDRIRAAADEAQRTLEAAQARESDPRVREDIGILLHAVHEQRRGLDVREALQIEHLDVARLAFTGIRVLLDDQNPPERKALALVRLRRYAGLECGLPPLAQLAERETRERLELGGRAFPYDVELRTALALAPILVDGIESLFVEAGIRGWEEPLAAFRRQIAGYATFVQTELLPRARADHRLPPQVYAVALEEVGVDIAPAELAAQAHAAYDRIAAEMTLLASQVAVERGLASRDYRDVISDLKRDQISGDADAVVAFYTRRLAEIEAICRRERLVTLPERPARIRIASLAESAELPAAHMNPPPLVGNTGQVGEFVLPLDVPAAPGAASTERSDDFTHDAVTWTLTAHEARPGHELQFTRMLENGLSLARAVFAFNSVNVEGWALYAERILLPYMPPAARLCSLQMRLHRAARAFLDPELQSGAISPAEAEAFLRREIVFSAPFARSEVERYTFRAPGQATSYFYGYLTFVALREDVEAMLGARFDARTFHDFVVDQGLVPPDTLRTAVLERFSTPA